jgi:uncharacterized protein
MNFWDASALVSLCVEEERTPEFRSLVGAGIVAWAVSRVEIASAIERQSREGRMNPEARSRALTALGELSDSWTEIHSLTSVCERALRLLAIHSLRAADAMQLAAALIAVSDRPHGHVFVGTDRRLNEAAAREGFRILPA